MKREINTRFLTKRKMQFTSKVFATLERIYCDQPKPERRLRRACSCRPLVRRTEGQSKERFRIYFVTQKKKTVIFSSENRF